MGLRNQLCWLPQKLRLTPLGTLRRIHQLATLMLDSPHRAEEESPTTPTATEADGNSPWNPEESPAGNPNTRLPCMPEESPTMPTTTEAEANSPQNPKEESPAGNPYARLTSQTRGVTNYADCHRSWGWLPSEPWKGVTSRQPWCWTPLSEQRRSHQLCQLPKKHLILIISRLTCTTYF